MTYKTPNTGNPNKDLLAAQLNQQVTELEKSYSEYNGGTFELLIVEPPFVIINGWMNKTEQVALQDLISEIYFDTTF